MEKYDWKNIHSMDVRNKYIKERVLVSDVGQNRVALSPTMYTEHWRHITFWFIGTSGSIEKFEAGGYSMCFKKP